MKLDLKVLSRRQRGPCYRYTASEPHGISVIRTRRLHATGYSHSDAHDY